MVMAQLAERSSDVSGSCERNVRASSSESTALPWPQPQHKNSQYRPFRRCRWWCRCRGTRQVQKHANAERCLGTDQQRQRKATATAEKALTSCAPYHCHRATEPPPAAARWSACLRAPGCQHKAPSLQLHPASIFAQWRGVPTNVPGLCSAAATPRVDDPLDHAPLRRAPSGVQWTRPYIAAANRACSSFHVSLSQVPLDSPCPPAAEEAHGNL